MGMGQSCPRPHGNDGGETAAAATEQANLILDGIGHFLFRLFGSQAGADDGKGTLGKINRISNLLGVKPVLMDPSTMAWCKRPRLFWLSYDLEAKEGEVWYNLHGVMGLKVSLERGPLDGILDQTGGPWAPKLGAGQTLSLIHI